MVGHENHLKSVHTSLYIRYFWYTTGCYILQGYSRIRTLKSYEGHVIIGRG
jgi:hypothetical protein